MVKTFSDHCPLQNNTEEKKNNLETGNAVVEVEGKVGDRKSTRKPDKFL